MRYTKDDIHKISIYKLLEAIGMRRVDLVSDDVELYYTPLLMIWQENGMTK